MTAIGVVNASTLIGTADAKTMVRAVAYQMKHHVAPAYNAQPVPVVYLGHATDAQPGMWVVTIYDDADQADALGYHTEQDGVIYGKVFARPSLDNGSRALGGRYAVSSILSHEVIEIFGNPDVNKWVINSQDGQGNPVAVAYELADPVEGQTYWAPGGGTSGGVAVSNFVLPAWFDGQNTTGPYDKLGVLTKPLAIAKSGYMEVWEGGKIVDIQGERAPAWRTESKKHPLSRSHRIAQVVTQR